MRRRVVITGVGAATPLGIGADALWDGVVAGRSAARPVEVEGVGTVPAFIVDDDDMARQLFGQRESRRMARAGRLGAVAGALALEDAGDHGADPERVGVSVGNVHGGAEAIFDGHRALLERGADRVSPLAIPLGLNNAPAAAVARALGLRGPANVAATACAAGSDAIGLALGILREGRADLMLAGGAEAPVSPFVVAGYTRVGALTRGTHEAARSSRPFDLARDGFVIGEGAGLLVLEDLERARARGARIYAEVAGYGATCDAAHLTDPDPAGLGAARAVAAALADAGLDPSEVGYVNAHATSTTAGDVAEARALIAAGLGDVPVSATKAAHGHSLGAAGGVEAVITALAIHRGVLPPTANLDTPDPEAPVPHITAARPAVIDVAVSNSFGFGGHNACLVLRRVAG